MKISTAAKRIEELEAQVADLKTKLEEEVKSRNYWYNANVSTKNQIDEIGAFLDALPNPPPSSIQRQNYPQEIPLLTRLAIWVVQFRNNPL